MLYCLLRRRSCALGVSWGLWTLRSILSMSLLYILPAEKSLEQELVTPILDIEDLVKNGSKHK